jgi:hypothetical protein
VSQTNRIAFGPSGNKAGNEETRYFASKEKTHYIGCKAQESYYKVTEIFLQREVNMSTFPN